MVKVKEDAHFLADGVIDPHVWLEHLAEKHLYPNLDKIQHACTLVGLTEEEHTTPTGESCLQAGLAIAEILLDLEVDPETLSAAIVYNSVQYADLPLEDVEEQLGKNVARLVLAVKRMEAVGRIQELKELETAHQQVDNLRKMLLAMVDDVRGVLIKLAERLHLLRTSAVLSDSIRRDVAREIMDIYAPLANRLGVGSLKWEMEDRAFRYLHSEEYKAIAKGLSAKRVERDQYVKHIVEALDNELNKAGLHHFKVYGRSKHIHSIYRKMVQKNKTLEEIYDATAVRVLVDTEEDCYVVLSAVHQLWIPISSEFDDYISNPKPNGYRSLHTAVVGPENKHFEVQIRTHEMHDLAELGVAAHWKYKEGGKESTDTHERKIEWLREVLAWNREVAKAEGVSNEIQTEFLEDRVYVFTPMGRIVDLPVGATPLDFAYHIHSDIGHGCRGAKVNGSIVNLVYTLKMGDQVEILSGKKLQPSRDWLNSHLGYLKTSRARAKVLHWFKEQDFERHQEEGEELLEREFKKLSIRSVALEDLAKQFKFKKKEDFFAALGRGDIKIGHVLQKVEQAEAPLIEPKITPTLTKLPSSEASDNDLYIEGVGNLLTRLANCCKPSVQDPIVGYVTIGRGISIHRKNCPNILALELDKDHRVVEVTWGKSIQSHYSVALEIHAYDRQGLIRDITHLMGLEKANVLQFTTTVNKAEHTAHVKLVAEIENLEKVSRLIEKLRQLPNIIHVSRLEERSND
jgi:GTP pyrophosphokinase